MLGEKAQIAAAKELILQILRLSKSSSEGNDSNIPFNPLVCALMELASLIQTLGTSALVLTTDVSAKCLDGVLSALILPCQAVRMAAAWCLKCITSAVPIHLTFVVDKYVTFLQIILFNVAEELLRCASQNPRLSSTRTTGGWIIISAIMTLGPSVVRGLLPRMLLLWRNTFPRSAKDLESEKSRGDAFTWQVTLEGRAGALCSIWSFLTYCSELVTEDVTRRLVSSLEGAVTMVANIGTVVKSSGQHLKAASAMVRFRLFSALQLLSVTSLPEGMPVTVLKFLATELTLGENPANTSTSLLPSLVEESAGGPIIGSLHREPEFRIVEDQLLPNSASGSGALEHDMSSLYNLAPGSASFPLPLGVAVIDSAVLLFGHLFPGIPGKQKLQVLLQFNEAISSAKSVRQEAVQMNVFAALLVSLDGSSELKQKMEKEDIRKGFTELIQTCITHSSPLLRYAAAETLGRLSKFIRDAKFLAEVSQNSCEKLKTSRDVASRTGHSLALGCLHRHMGGMSSGHQLNTSVSILLALSQDFTSPVVQAWALHALSLIADSGGPSFRGYVEPALGYILKLLLMTSSFQTDVQICSARFLAALIIAIGPELQGNSPTLNETRRGLRTAIAILEHSGDALVLAEAIACLQQLHLFASSRVNLSLLVPLLCQSLCSDRLPLRRAAISCLRQLTQREASSICDLAATLAAQESAKGDKDLPPGTLVMTETGLPGLLLSLLDREKDPQVIKNIQDTLCSVLMTLAEENLGDWILLCKRVLTTATDSTSQEGEGEEGEVEDEEFKTGNDEGDLRASLMQPRWPTRVFAASCVRKLIAVCAEGSPAQLDLSLARTHRLSGKPGNFLVLYLSDLVRVAFLAAVSDSDPLRLEGLATLQLIVEKFAKVPEPEFPGHVILEQYQAQVSAALRPAFAPEVPSHVTARACQVCSSWIGSGVARDLNDLRRIHQLLKSSLCKLQRRDEKAVRIQYNESAATLEKLAILKAWAEVYIVAMTSNSPSSQPRNSGEKLSRNPSPQEETLLSLVRPELMFLSKYWIAALRDHALLALPAEFSSQLPRDGGAFYTNDILDLARPHYRAAWAPILHAVCLWFNSGGFDNVHLELSEIDVTNSMNLGLGPANASASKNPEEINSDRFHLVFGICMEALCNPRASDPTSTCLDALRCLLDAPWPRKKLMEDSKTAIELCAVLHRLLLTRDNVFSHLTVTKIVHLILLAGQEKLEELSVGENSGNLGSPPANQVIHGFTTDTLEPGDSLIYAVLEILLCILVRQLPDLNPVIASQGTSAHLKAQKLDASQQKLVESTVSLFPKIPNLCCSRILKEMATKPVGDPTIMASSGVVQSCLQTLKALANHPFTKDRECASDWAVLLQGALSYILDITKTGPGDGQLDEVSMLLAVALFALHAPESTMKAQNLLYPSVNLYQQYFASDNIMVCIKCVQTLRAIFQTAPTEVAYAFIHSLAPRIIESVYAVTATSDDHAVFVQECLTTLETLVANVKPDCRLELIGLFIPALIGLVLDSNSLQSASRAQKTLHSFSLQQVMKIGPLYPEDFRQLMTKVPTLKTRLESALLENQRVQRKLSTGTAAISRPSQLSLTSQPPSIALKTDFSNFY
ncbi:unnamed protein product [Cyprideis torosa]|uniref:Uncharacterized protein n=1 Tax=Cyprideis torosa TaxID=163714 RepID=A0A7R8WFE5_9CRUS|nr:unnamed protein product [Cyprideis torosa]CAG0891768.1 unnamed protein product [Cyprideis torosa]